MPFASRALRRALDPGRKDFALCARDVRFAHIFDRKFYPLLMKVPDRQNIFCRPDVQENFLSYPTGNWQPMKSFE